MAALGSFLASLLVIGLCLESVRAACIMDRSFLAEDLDKQRFAGKWYMTSWYYHGTGKRNAPAIENVQAMYTLRNDGNWNITYGTGIMEGMCYKNPVEAMVDKNSDRMLWIFNFHLHEIMSTDYDNYAVLYQCLDGMTYCVIESTQIAVLSRKPTVQSEAQTAINKAIANACIDVNDMVAISQKRNCICSPDVTYGLTKSCDFE